MVRRLHGAAVRHFASAATVNLLKMLTGAAQSNWELALLRLGGVVLYAFAVFLTAWAAQADSR